MRMMPVSNEITYPSRRKRPSRRLALFHFILILTALLGAWFGVGGNTIQFAQNEHVTRIDTPLLYTFSLLLMGMHCLVVSVGLLMKRLWAWKWARITPVMAVPLWVTFTWGLAEEFALATVNFRVCSDETMNPIVTTGQIGTAGLYCSVFWLLIGFFYVRKLKKSEASAELVGGPALSAKIRAICAIVLVMAPLLLLLNFKMPDGRMLIHDASSYGWIGVANMIRIAGQSVNARTKRGYTPLHFAAESGRLDMVTNLLKHGASINARDESGCTAIMVAAESDWSNPGHNADPYATLVMLVKRGADVRIKDTDGLTVSNHLIGKPKYPSELVKLIVERGVPLNVGVRGEWVNFTLLGYAVESGRTEDVDYLLSHGAEMYPLLIICTSPSMLRHLFSQGFDANSRDEEGKTPLHHLVGYQTSSEDQIACAQMLLKHGADINAKDNEKQTPLHIADMNHDEEWARFLLDHGAE